MKILLFGSGFIATSILEYLPNAVADGDVEFVGIYSKHKFSNGGIKQYHISESMEDIILNERPDYIICLQGNSFVPDNISIHDSIQNNVMQIGGFLELLYETQLFKQVKSILVVGSAGEYGKLYDQPIDEDTSLRPTSLYGLSKIFLYNCAMYFYERGLPVKYVRQFNTVGPNQREQFVFQSFIKQLVLIEKGINKNEIKVGDLSQERDFIDVRDTVRAYMHILDAGVHGEVYNVGSGKYISIRDLLDKMVDLSLIDRNQLRIVENKSLFSDEGKLSRRLCAGTEKIEGLDFNCIYNLEDTINVLFDYWRNKIQS